jgi:hypothetical protein
VTQDAFHIREVYKEYFNLELDLYHGKPTKFNNRLFIITIRMYIIL